MQPLFQAVIRYLRFSPLGLPLTIERIDYITPLLLLSGCVLLASLARWQRGKLLRILAHYDDLRAVGPLAEALQLGNRRAASEAAAALIGLLPRLRVADAKLLNAKQRACLHNALDGKNVALAVAILNAFQQVGEERDLRVVERLAQGKRMGRKNKRVQEAARECLPFLRARLAQQHTAQTLLRATGVPDNVEKTLLRAAKDVQEIDPQHLLRASVPGSLY